MKKVALVHDYIKEYGGAERVLESLHEMYPDAPVFTLIYAPDFLGPHKEKFAKWDIRPSFLQQLPYAPKLISVYRLIAPLVFKTFDFSGYDVIIVSATGAYSPNMIDKKKAKQVCYCHTPPRYLYGYATAREQTTNPILMFLTQAMLHILRMVDFDSSKHVDVFVANSKNINRRIEKFYRRGAVVVYPPVDVQKNKAKKEDKGYFLAGGRIARPKHIDVIAEACSILNVPLKIFGKSFAGYGEEIIRKVKGNKNIDFLGEVSDEEKTKLMLGGKAFIFAAEDEDFGIVPVEAMSFGLPVIAYKSGGVLETVVDGKTGIFFDTLTIESLMGAIKQFEKMKFDTKACIFQAEKFSKEKFIKQIRNVVGA